MAKHGGFNMGSANMESLMKQAKKMQEQLQKQAEELEEKEFTASSGGNAVTVTVSGKKQLKSISISKDALDPDDVDMLQDMIIACVNEAMKKVDEESAGMLGAAAGKIPGGFPF